MSTTAARSAVEATALYRFFDADGTLLYVGITSDLPARVHQHDHHQPWWHLVASATVEHFVDRVTAGAAEVLAIHHESPRFNRAHARGHMVMRSLRVPEKLWNDAKAKADEQDLNISDVVRELLAEWVDEE